MRTGSVTALSQVVIATLAIVLVDMWISGYVLFGHAANDPLAKADAIVVLGGEHDGREDYAIGLAKDGWASTVVLSNPYLQPDPVMERVCRNVQGKRSPVEVMCPVPSPLTTRGEATMMRKLAHDRSWTKIIVVTWQYHLPRARLVFRQCFSDQPGATVMRAVPRPYEFSPVTWASVYTYQFAGFAKAIAQGDCS
jgi:uncharacterized SAM-binding protein YcdF (DUF218 family)